LAIGRRAKEGLPAGVPALLGMHEFCSFSVITDLDDPEAENPTLMLLYIDLFHVFVNKYSK